MLYEEMQQAQDGGFGGMYYVSRYFMYSQYCICEKNHFIPFAKILLPNKFTLSFSVLGGRM